MTSHETVARVRPIRLPGIGRRARIALAAAVVLVACVVLAAAIGPISSITTLLTGLTSASLYFLVAAGFTIVFGLLRVTNLAHGSLYLLGGYFGYSIVSASGNWFLGIFGASIGVAVAGLVLQQGLLRWVQGDQLREALVTVGVLIVVADQTQGIWGSGALNIDSPAFLNGGLDLGGGLIFSTYRLAILGIALIIGGLLWLLLHKTRFGLAVRAGVDDKGMLSALGTNVQLLFAAVFALGALLAGFAGVVGGSYLSIAPGEDGRYLLMSLVVVIVGGMGSITGAALGALLIGVVESFAQVYASTYSVLVSFGVMVLVLAVRPQGLLGSR